MEFLTKKFISNIKNNHNKKIASFENEIFSLFTSAAYPCAAAVPDSGTELTISALQGDSLAKTLPHCMRTE